MSSPTSASHNVTKTTSPPLQRPSRNPRRKVMVEDALATSTAVQRLVEYFIVVSSVPRWETNTTPPPPQLQTPNPNNQKTRQSLKDSIAETKQKQKLQTTRSQIFGDTPDLRNQQRTSAMMAPEDLLTPEPLNLPAATTKTIGTLGSRFRPFRSSFGIHIDEKKEVDVCDKPENTGNSDSAENAPTEQQNENANRDPGRATENIHMPFNDPNVHSFQPVITARFPLADYQDNPLNPMITQFCYPSGDVIVPSRVYELPRVHHFVLTNGKGRKVYGTCLTLYEEYQASDEEPWITRENIYAEDSEHDIEVTMRNKEATLYIPKVLCILSTWPYLTAFREYLAQLYRLASSTNIMQTPIERYVLNLCMEIPAPPPGAYEVQLSILNSTIRFWAPPAKLPIAYVALPYQTLFDCLDVDNILLLWNALIMEHKILLVSSQHSILTISAEILTSLLFPMRWCHLYVPLLPRFICPMLDAPVPYLCGVIRENWLYAQQFVCRETIIVDLDRNTVAVGDMTPEFVAPPTKKWGKLKEAIDITAGHLFYKARGQEKEYSKVINGRQLNQKRALAILQNKGSLRWKEKLHSFDHAFNLAYTPTSENLLNDAASDSHQSQWDKVQEAFLRFFVALLKDYRKFLSPPEGNSPGNFDKEDFITSQKSENQPFLWELCETQQFEDYLTKRLYSPGEPDVIFFDQSIDAKLNRSRLKLRKVDTPFLQSAKTHKVLKKVQAVEPCTENLPAKEDSGPYFYKVWPETFKNELFCEPKPIPRIISAEFDRQAVLVSRLRKANYKTDEEGFSGKIVEDENGEFFAADYDPSPEVAAFTVFFFTYSTLIGQEWQEFQKKKKELEMLQTPRRPQSSIDLKSVTLKQQNSDSPPIVKPTIDTTNVTSSTCNNDCNVSMCDDFAAPNIASALSKSTPFSTKFYFDFMNFTILSTTAKKKPQEQPKDPTFNTPDRANSLVDYFDDKYAEYEEARAVASAQLDLAFEALNTLTKLRNLEPDVDAYKSLMGACGRCGDSSRALELIEVMKRDGLVDGRVLNWFVLAFATNDGDAADRLSPACRDNIRTPYRGSDAYYKQLSRKLQIMEQTHQLQGSASCLSGLLSSDDDDCSSVFSADSGANSVASAPTSSSAIMEWFTPHKKHRASRKKRKSKKRRRKSSTAMDMPVSDTVAKQYMLAENLLDFLYPTLTIDKNSDSCPQCSAELKEADIVQGWVPCAFNNYTTCCPQCKHRFVPRFSVQSGAVDFQGSQGLGTPLYCEYLSPWVLRKELDAVAKGPGGIEAMTDPEWRSGTDINSTLWWNMIALCQKYRLPFTYLLQGSFQNRLISPTP